MAARPAKLDRLLSTGKVRWARSVVRGAAEGRTPGEWGYREIAGSLQAGHFVHAVPVVAVPGFGAQQHTDRQHHEQPGARQQRAGRAFVERLRGDEEDREKDREHPHADRDRQPGTLAQVGQVGRVVEVGQGHDNPCAQGQGAHEGADDHAHPGESAHKAIVPVRCAAGSTF